MVTARPLQARGQNAVMLILPAVLLLYASMLPAEVRISLAGLNLYAPRLVGLALLPIILNRLVKDPIKVNLCDVGILAAAFWMTFAFSAYYGPAEGFVRGAALSIDVAVPYILARACIRSLSDLRRFLVLAAPALLIAGLLMLLEVMAGQPVVRPAAASIFGTMSAYEGGIAVGNAQYGTEQRLGILRASGPFSHPILAGLFLASFLPLYFHSGLRKWPYSAGLGATGFAILSASSGPILAIIVMVGLLVTDWLQRIITFISWKLIIPVSLALMAVLNMGTEKGLIPFITQFTINPQTAHYRRLIWRFGVESVEKNPWIGIGFDNFQRLHWMISSVDNHWLLVAMRYGVFPAFSILAVVLGAVFVLSKASARHSEIDRRLLVGLAISLFTFALLGFSVAFFGGAKTWFYMLLGIAVGVGFSTLGSAPTLGPSRHQPRPRAIPRSSPLRQSGAQGSRE